MLQPLRSAIYAFKTDFVIANWIARLKPGDLAVAQAELKSAGFTNPTIRDFNDKALDIKAIDKPLDVLMEAAPEGVDPDELGRAICDTAGVVSVHELHVWTVTSGFDALAAAVERLVQRLSAALAAGGSLAAEAIAVAEELGKLAGGATPPKPPGRAFWK